MMPAAKKSVSFNTKIALFLLIALLSIKSAANDGTVYLTQFDIDNVPCTETECVFSIDGDLYINNEIGWNSNKNLVIKAAQIIINKGQITSTKDGTITFSSETKEDKLETKAGQKEQYPVMTFKSGIKAEQRERYHIRNREAAADDFLPQPQIRYNPETRANLKPIEKSDDSNQRDKYYEILGNPEHNCTAIRNAFRELAYRYHPDKNPKNKEWASNVFILINNAYSRLIELEECGKKDSHIESNQE